MNFLTFRHVSEATLAELADAALLQAQLSAPERRHLETCDRCQQLLEGHQRAGRLLAADWQMVNLEEATTVAGAPTRVVGRTRMLPRAAADDGPASLGRQLGPVVAAVAVVAVVGVALLWSGGQSPNVDPGAQNSPSSTPSFTPGPSEPSPSSAPGVLDFQPQHVAVDAAGRVYTSECDNHRVLRLGEPGGPVVVAGSGSRGFSGDGGPATEAQLDCPYQLAFDATGDLYVADTGNNRIRKIDAAGVISTVAGSGPGGWLKRDFAGDGGPADEARLSNPAGIAFDDAGNLYIADMNNNRLRMVDTDGIITTVAGDGTLFPQFGGDGGPAIQATLRSPQGLAIDGAGNVYFTDTGNNRLRMIDSGGRITTIAGTGEHASYGDGGPAEAAALAAPRAVLVDGNGNIYVSEAVWDVTGTSPLVPEEVGNRTRLIDRDGVIHAFAGTGDIGFAGDGGPALAAQLNGVNQNFGLAIDSAGNVYIADSGNRRIRIVQPTGIITTFAGGSR